MRHFAMTALLALAGTGVAAAAQPGSAARDTDGLELRLAGDGFGAGERGLDGSASIRFGVSRAQAIRHVTGMAGAVSATGMRRSCGRPTAFARFRTLTLYFRQDRFVGWSLTGPRTRPMADGFLESEWGTGIGTPRHDIAGGEHEAVFRRTAHGTEFDADGMHGALTGAGPDARVSAMWAGVTCRGR